MITSAVTGALAGLLMGYVLQRGQLCFCLRVRLVACSWAQEAGSPGAATSGTGSPAPLNVLSFVVVAAMVAGV